jgi:hypothetical protein
VKTNPDLATATVIFDPFGTVIPVMPNVYTPVPVLVSTPFVAPVRVKSAADKPATSALKVNVSAVVLTVPFVPLAVTELKVIGVIPTFTGTVRLAGVNTNPVLVTATVRFAPLATTILLTPRV